MLSERNLPEALERLKQSAPDAYGELERELQRLKQRQQLILRKRAAKCK